MLGQHSENEISIVRRCKQFLGRAANASAIRQRRRHRADRAPHDSRVNQLADRQPIDVRPTDRDGPTSYERNDIGRRRADVDQHTGLRRDPLRNERSHRMPVRRRRLSMPLLRFLRRDERAVGQIDPNVDLRRGRGDDRIDNCRHSVALRREAIAQLAGHRHGPIGRMRSIGQERAERVGQFGRILPQGKRLRRAITIAVGSLEIRAADVERQYGRELRHDELNILFSCRTSPARGRDHFRTMVIVGQRVVKTQTYLTLPAASNSIPP